jgi:hypothetical protein
MHGDWGGLQFHNEQKKIVEMVWNRREATQFCLRVQGSMEKKLRLKTFNLFFQNLLHSYNVKNKIIE